MEKNDLYGILVYLIMLVMLFVVGQTVFALGSEDLAQAVGNYRAFVILVIIASALLFSIIYEIGHIIGAKIGKYKLISLNIFGLCFTKDDKKWNFKFKSPEGLLSESRFVPSGENCNPKKFLWGGVCAFFVSALLGLTMFLIPKISMVVSYCIIIYIAIGLIMVFYNIVPIPLDILNDGYRIKLLGDKSNVDAYNEFMRIENDVRQGVEPHDVKEYENVTPMTVTVNMIRFYELLKNGKDEEAFALNDKMLENTEMIDSSTITRLYANKLYHKIMNEPIEEIKEYYWKTLSSKERKNISQDKSVESRRAYLLISGVINESISESRIALANYRQVKKIQNKVKKNVEIRLYKEAMDKVKEILQDAEFEDLL